MLGTHAVADVRANISSIAAKWAKIAKNANGESTAPENGNRPSYWFWFWKVKPCIVHPFDVIKDLKNFTIDAAVVDDKAARNFCAALNRIEASQPEEETRFGMDYMMPCCLCIFDDILLMNMLRVW